MGLRVTANSGYCDIYRFYAAARHPMGALMAVNQRYRFLAGLNPSVAKPGW